MVDSHMTQEDESKAVVEAYVDALNRGDLNALKSLIAEAAEIRGAYGKALSSGPRPFGAN